MPMKRPKILPGAILKIAFDGPWNTYGRLLRYGDVVVYDARATEDCVDVDALITAPVVFRGMMNDGPVKGKLWPMVGFVPLTEPQLQHSTYFLPQVGDPNRFLLFRNGSYLYDQPRSAVVGLTSGGIWDAGHIESILRDFYAGTENPFLKMAYMDLGLSLPVY